VQLCERRPGIVADRRGVPTSVGYYGESFGLVTIQGDEAIDSGDEVFVVGSLGSGALDGFTHARRKVGQTDRPPRRTRSVGVTRRNRASASEKSEDQDGTTPHGTTVRWLDPGIHDFGHDSASGKRPSLFQVANEPVDLAFDSWLFGPEILGVHRIREPGIVLTAPH
jgi:hypothetical protein